MLFDTRSELSRTNFTSGDTNFHRVRHYGLLSNGGRKDNIALARKLLGGKNNKDHDETRNKGDAVNPANKKYHLITCQTVSHFLRFIIKSHFRSGGDTVENAIALCPNCHRKYHYG